MSVAGQVKHQERARPVRTTIIDCDVHNAMRSPATLKKYLGTRWHREFDLGGTVTTYEALRVGAKPIDHPFRLDSFPNEGVPGSDLDLMREQLLDRYNVQAAIIHPVTDIVRLRKDGEAGLAMMSALNDWMDDEWLSREPRCRGAISIPFEDPVHSVVEIERRAEDPRWAKVMIPAKTREGLGHSKYWPIYETAAACGLPVAIHVSGFSGTATSTGWPTYFVEYQVAHTADFVAQLSSLLCSGILDRLSDLNIILEEASVGWLLPLMWRLERAWRLMPEDMPALTRSPTEIIRQRIWLTTQPLDEPNNPKHLQETIALLGMNDRIMFATDYPHWNFDDPDRSLSATAFDRELRQKILFDNANALFFSGNLGA